MKLWATWVGAGAVAWLLVINRLAEWVPVPRILESAVFIGCGIALIWAFPLVESAIRERLEAQDSNGGWKSINTRRHDAERSMKWLGLVLILWCLPVLLGFMGGLSVG